MADFSDVMRFAETHRPCGGATPAVTPQPSGAYLLTLSCACGAVLDRLVTADEAKQAPFLTGAPPPVVAATAPRRPDPPRLMPSPELERAMREALEAEEAPTEPTPARPAPRIAPSPELEAVLREALEAEEAAPMSAAPPSRSTPAAPAAEPHDRTAPSPELEAVLRQAVTASAAGLETKKPASPKRAPGPPPTSNVRATMTAALREQERLRVDLTKGPRSRRARSRRGWLGLAALVLVGAGAGAVVYVGSAPEEEAPVAATSGATAPQNVAGTFGNAVRVLRQVQALSGPASTLPAYEAQVGVVQAIVGRYLDGDAPPDVKGNVRAILDLHLLAVAAWRVRAIDTSQAWEPVSRSPALDLCAPVRNVAYIAERAGQNNAQARGRAIAGAIPLLWECTSARLAQLDAAR